MVLGCAFECVGELIVQRRIEHRVDIFLCEGCFVLFALYQKVRLRKGIGCAVVVDWLH